MIWRDLSSLPLSPKLAEVDDIHLLYGQQELTCTAVSGTKCGAVCSQNVFVDYDVGGFLSSAMRCGSEFTLRRVHSDLFIRTGLSWIIITENGGA